MNPKPARGFTLIELMVVIALIAIASGLATLALRDPAATQLEHEAARLAALFEGARAEARASGFLVTWQLGGRDNADVDFRFDGLPPQSEMPERWLDRHVGASIVGARAVVLGPEPVIGPQRVVLSLEGRRLVLATDGLEPFTVQADAATP